MYQSLRFRRLVRVAGALALLVAVAPVRAQRVDASEFTRCTTIADRGDRVDCYDAAAARVARAAPNGVAFNFQVDKPAMYRAGDAPAYPAVLRNAGLQGDVLASFVLDTLGQADMTTFRVLQSDNPLFTDAVRTALPGLMYSPATLRDQKVPVLVQQSFHFREQTFRQQNAPAAPR